MEGKEGKMPETIFGQMRSAITNLDADQASAICKKGLGEGLDPVEMINQGIHPALEAMGESFGSGNIFLPELMLAAKAADAAVSVLEPELLKRGTSGKNQGKILMATVKGDIHDIGKNIVTLLLKSAGFQVVDIGVDKSGEEILAAARKNQVDVIGLSALLTTTILHMKEVMELIQESGLRNQIKVIVGGAPVTQEFADLIGADGYGADAPRAVEVTKRLLAR
jgi:corrinoid protein of di/trimethylamine methyltransferase